jgi:O-antigen/teichoic acid export membrane protein
MGHALNSRSSISLAGGLLARNTIYNLVGNGLPLLAALLAIPILLNGLGTDRFGVLMLAWGVIGYFSLFDLGLGRALTQLVARKLGSGGEDEIPAIVWTALLLMLMLGVFGLLVALCLARLLVYDVLKVPVILQHESLYGFYLLSVSIPAVICTAGVRGILEAKQRFDLVSIIRSAIGIFSFAGPAIVLPFSHSLFAVIAVLVVGRIVGCMVYIVLCLRVIPVLGYGIKYQRQLIRPLISFGGWMTISNIISPIMVNLGRFLIGALISVAAVSYYATPFDVVTKILIIPSAFVAVLFPAFSSAFQQDPYRTAQLFFRGIKYTFLLLFPITIFIVIFAKELLLIWLGIEFAENSYVVMQLLVVGVLMNGIASVPFALIQGVGRPDITGKLHLLELPIYLITAWWLVSAYGIKGAAACWLLRVGIDALALFAISSRLLPAQPHRRSWLMYVYVTVIGLAIVNLTAFTLPFFLKVGFFLLFLCIYIWIVWVAFMDINERFLLKQKMGTCLKWK